MTLRDSDIIMDEIKRCEHKSLEDLWVREKELREEIAERLDRLSAVRTVMHDTPTQQSAKEIVPALFCANKKCSSSPAKGSAYCEEHR